MEHLAPPAPVEQTIDSYHRLGPLASPSEMPPFSLDTMAAKMVAPLDAQANPLSWLAQNARSERLGAKLTSDQGLEAASMLSDTLFSLDATKANPGHKAMLFAATQNILRKPADSASPRNEQAEARVRNFDIINWFQRNNEPVPGIAEHGERAEKLIDGLLALRASRTDGKFGDGEMFEHTLSLMLQFKLWQQEMDGPDTFARLATRREDRPARGMPKESGTRVAHDVVMQINGQTVRLQAKQGENAHELDMTRYDYTKVTPVIETASGKDLDAILMSVGMAYKGDAAAVTVVDRKLEAYGLMKIITGARVPRAAGSLAIAGAIS